MYICGLLLIVLEGSGACCFLLSGVGGVRLIKKKLFLTRFIDSEKTGCCKLPRFLNVNCFTLQPDSETQHIQNKSKIQVVTAHFLCVYHFTPRQSGGLVCLLQDFGALVKYMQRFSPNEFLVAMSDFHLLVFLSTSEIIPVRVSLFTT